MLPSDKILKHRNKVYAIPYNVFTQRQFKDAFIEGSEIYMAPEGTLALPLSVNPLVMYWNRQMFTEANLTQPPNIGMNFIIWRQLYLKKMVHSIFLKSAVAMGEFSNISNAKEIISIWQYKLAHR